MHTGLYNDIRTNIKYFKTCREKNASYTDTKYDTNSSMTQVHSRNKDYAIIKMEILRDDVIHTKAETQVVIVTSDLKSATLEQTLYCCHN